MIPRLYIFELNGQEVLGFDTGLNAQAFAQAKMAQFITQSGLIVHPSGKTEQWKAVGVEERNGTMVIWGPYFSGERLDSLLKDQDHKDEALNAARFWLRAQAALIKENIPFFPGAAGALIVTGKQATPDYTQGTILFPPERLIKRCLEAEGDEVIFAAQQWIHPDFKDEDAIVFSAATMVYTVLSGDSPFLPRGYSKKDGDTLRQDMREGVYIPLRLATPGLDARLAEVLNDALEPVKKQQATGKKRPLPDSLKEALGNKKVASFFNPLDESEAEKIKTELEQFIKSRDFTVKTRRFIVRNTTILIICLAAVLGGALIVRGHLIRLAERPNTLGMTPIEVIETYYGAFETLDHELMQACTTGRRARMDVDMVVNLFVITRNRMAYEPAFRVISAQDWLDAGSFATENTVFGVTDIGTRILRAEEEVYYLEAVYTLWMPAGFIEEIELPSDEEILRGDFVTPPPQALHLRDELRLIWVRDSWRIEEITRFSIEN